MSEKQAVSGGKRASAGFPPVPTGRTGQDLAQFWSDYRSIVVGAAVNKLRNRNVPTSLLSVDEVVQEVYTVLHENWADVEDPARYVFGKVMNPMVRRAVREMSHRAGAVARDHDAGDDTAEFPETGPGLEEITIEQQVEDALREALPAAMEALTGNQRWAVELTTDGKTSREEAATVMGMAEGTVSSHRARGLEKLRSALGAIAVVAVMIGLHSQANGTNPVIAFVLEGIAWIATMTMVAAALARRSMHRSLVIRCRS